MFESFKTMQNAENFLRELVSAVILLLHGQLNFFKLHTNAKELWLWILIMMRWWFWVILSDLSDLSDLLFDLTCWFPDSCAGGAKQSTKSTTKSTTPPSGARVTTTAATTTAAAATTTGAGGSAGGSAKTTKKPTTTKEKDEDEAEDWDTKFGSQFQHFLWHVLAHPKIPKKWTQQVAPLISLRSTHAIRYPHAIHTLRPRGTSVVTTTTTTLFCHCCFDQKW